MLPKSKGRYLPRHKWYLPEAQVLIRQLQAVAWPISWHIALGGGVLNHGYSDGDLDLYALPIYNQPHEADALELLGQVATVLQSQAEWEPVHSLEDNPHECYIYSVRYPNSGKTVELFIVRKSDDV